MSTQAANPQRREDVLRKELGTETVLYHKDGKAIHVLNGTALAIWEACDGQHSLDDIEEIIRRRFAVSDEQTKVKEDIRRTLQEFHDNGLLQST